MSDLQTRKGRINPRGANQNALCTAYFAKRYFLWYRPWPVTGKTDLRGGRRGRYAGYVYELQRILLVRPAVEAGEKLGFLPGDLSQKNRPLLLRPLYDALYEMLGFEKVAKLIERQVIELRPSPTCVVVP